MIETQKLKNIAFFLNIIEMQICKIERESPQVLSKEKFIGWVLEGRIHSAAYDVRKDLPNILKCKPARKVFVSSN